MSRCFPYPPPGYTLSRANNDALIESIKLQKEKEKTREHKKEKRSEKKEKEKRKEKRKDEKDHQNKSDISKTQTFGKFSDAKGVPTLKGKEIVTEQLECSDLTQEHGLPVRMDVLPTSSAESTDTTNKRKRDKSPLNDNRTGNILRIKLASKKQKTDANPGVNELRVITKLEIMNLSAENKNFKNVLRHGREDHNVAPRTNGDQICSVSGPAESLTNANSSIPHLPNTVVNSMGRKERKFNKLILNWSPPQLLQQLNLDAEDLDWLLRKPEASNEKSQKTQNSTVSCLSSSLMQPRAQLLSEVNIYALPFTVPF